MFPIQSRVDVIFGGSDLLTIAHNSDNLILVSRTGTDG